MTNIHIMTSTKGGVGKTLICLCSLLHYYNRSRPLIGADINTMNPDFFRIMSFGQKPKTIPQTDWEKLDMGATNIALLRPSKPRSLPDGAIGFWRKVEQLSALNISSNADVIIDTNLHVANLVQSDETKSPLPIIEQMIIRGIRIYIWVIWSWASFQEILPIYSAFDTLCHKFDDNVSIVHVLNPSAIVPPQTEIVTRSQVIFAVAKAVAGLKEIASIYGEDDSAQFLIKAINSMNSQKKEDMKEDEFKVSGLHELSKADPAHPMSLTAFRKAAQAITTQIKESSPADASLFVPVNNILQRVIKGLSIDNNIAESDIISIKDMKRPSNLLAIGVHDTRLSGYTDKFARNPAENIDHIVNEIVPSIRSTVDNFLMHVTPIRPIDS